MIKRIKHFSYHTFSSLKIYNFRLYFVGQAISQSGNWMQTVGQSWLVLSMTGSGASLGLTLSLQYLPILILAPFGGVITDRYDKRKFLFLTQSVCAIISLIFTLLIALNIIELWMIYLLTALLGVVSAFDNPTRQSFVTEIADKENLRNATALISTQTNLARVIGPILAGIIIAKIGFTFCFALNVVSYLAVLICLLLMRSNEIDASRPIEAVKGELVKGFRYIANTPIIKNMLIIVTIVGTLSYEFLISLPMLARNTFKSDASSYGLLASGIAIGSVLAGLATARHKKVSAEKIAPSLLGFGISVLLVALAPNIILATIGMIIVGFFSIYFLTTGSTIIQTESIPHMRGRVFSFWAVGLLGSTAIGAPIIGWVGQTNPRYGLVVGALAAIGCAIFSFIVFKKQNPSD